MADFKPLEYGDEVEEYISPHEKRPVKPRTNVGGRPRIYTIEEARLRANERRMKYYFANKEKEDARTAAYRQKIKQQN
eukprot:12888198-Prorocentrum_lima.AAC.1